MRISDMSERAHANAVDKGFWGVDEEDLETPAEYAYTHMVLSMAMEAARADDPVKERMILEIVKGFVTTLSQGQRFPADLKLPQHAEKLARLALMHSELSEGVEGIVMPDVADNSGEEMADVVIRIGDYCGGYDIDLEEEVRLKMDKNAGRPRLHGKKY